MPTTVVVVFEARPGSGEALYHALSGSDDVLVAVEGCRGAQVLRDAHDPDRVVGIEVWDRPHQHEAWLADQLDTYETIRPLLARDPAIHYLR